MNTLTPQTAKVNDGVTLNCYSDSQSHTIVGIARNGRQITIQRDSAVRSNQTESWVIAGSVSSFAASQPFRPRCTTRSA